MVAIHEGASAHGSFQPSFAAAAAGNTAGPDFRTNSAENPVFVETTNKRRIWPLFVMRTSDNTRSRFPRLHKDYLHTFTRAHFTVGFTAWLIMYMRKSAFGGVLGDSEVS